MNLNGSNSRIPEPTANGLSVNGNHSAPNGHRPQAEGMLPTPKPRSEELSVSEMGELFSQGLLIIRAKWYWGALAAAIIGGLGLFLIGKSPTEFIAETDMVAQSTLDKIILTQDAPNSDSMSRENDLRNHLSVMSSRKFRTLLAASFTPEEKKEIAAPYLKPGEKVLPTFIDDYLEGHIAVERERGREFFTIDVHHRDQDTALMIADRFTAQYLQLIQSEFRDANKAGFDLLDKQADTLRAEIGKTEEERLEYRKKNKIISEADNQGLLSDRLKRLDADLTDIRVRRVQLETQSNQARVDRGKSEYPWDNPYLATFANNEQLRQELDRDMAQRSVLSSKYGPNHPKMRDMDASLTGVRDNIQRNFDIAVRDLETQLAAARTTEKQLQAEFDASFASSIEVEKLASRLEMLGTNLEAKQLTLAELQKKIGEAGLSAQLPADFMQVVDPAFITQPRIPRKLIEMIVVLFFAGCAFVAAPLGVNLMDARIKGTSDLEAVLKKPMLGAIPQLKINEADRAHLVRNRIDLGSTEAFIGVTAQLDINAGQVFPRVILVTSAIPGEGKSTLVSNFAATYTQLGRKTLIIDLDLRRPTQQNLHSIKSNDGFLRWVEGGCIINDSLMDPGSLLGIQKLADGTCLIPAGGSEAQPTHHFVKHQLEDLLDFLKKSFEVIIIDTPPAGLFQDAIVLARHADDRVLVTREAKAPVAQVLKVIADFKRAHTDFSGVILNGFSAKKAHKKLAYSYNPGNYGYHYGPNGANGSKMAKPSKSAKVITKP